MQLGVPRAVLCVLSLIAMAGPARAEICYDPQSTTPGSTELISGEQAQTSDQGGPDVGPMHQCPDDPIPPTPPPPPEPVVKGYIDGIVTDGGGTPRVRGWACATTLSQSISVHLYVGGAAGSGAYLGAHTANVSSGTGVANACDAAGNHRFYIPLTDAQRLAHAGEKIYVHGISPVGGSNNLMAKSGQYAVPVLPNDPPSVTLTAPADGTHKIAPAQFSLTATASDSDGSIASVAFYADGAFLIRDNTAPYAYRGWADVGVGTHQVQARARDDRGATNSSAIHTVIVDAPNVLPSVSLTAPANGASDHAPGRFTITANASDSDGDGIVKVQFKADGAVIHTDSSAPYAYTWSNVGIGSYSLRAIAHDGRGGVTTSAARTLTVTEPPNVPPEVSLTAPANGTSDHAPGRFTITANASDSDGDGIVKVQFKADGALIRTDTTAPYSYTWSDVGIGSYTLRAVAHDGRGGVTTSAARTVTVTEPPNIPPTVSLTAPANGASDHAPGSFTITANASDSDGDGIVKVQFKADGAVIHTDTSAPYAYTWRNVGIGSYSLRAIAHDGRGGVTTSAARTVTVTEAEAPNIPPTVSLTAPANGASDHAPGRFTITANASDSDGDGIVKVQFKADGAIIHADTSAPYAYTWSNVGIGSYTLRAVAHDGRGGVTPSAARTVTVTEAPNLLPVVSLESPENGTSSFAPGRFTLVASASDPDHDGIIGVTFKADGDVIYEDTVAPWRYAWHNVAVGTHTLQAVARDGRGGVTASATRSVTVTAPPSDGVDSVTRRYVYDAHQRLCKTIEPETGATIVAFDASGNVAWTASGQPLLSPTDCQRDEVPLAQRVTRQYGARNRVLAVDYPDNRGNTTYTYTPDGLPSTIATNGGTHVVTTRYGYNRRRLMTTEQLAWGSINWQIGYAYNANGHLAAHTYPDGLTVDYAPNALGQPTRAGSFATGVRYHPNGAIKQFTYGNGINHSLTQNQRGLPLRSLDAYFGEAVLDDSYDYDFNGNVAAISDALPGHKGDRTMTYDRRDRLVRVVSPMFGGDKTAVFAYDVVDNLTYARVGNVIDGVSYHYDPNNRLTNVRNAAGATVIGLGYGPRGNVVNKNGKVFDFDYGNRLRSISGSPVSSYVYDGLGRRVADYAGGGKYSMYSAAGQLMYTVDQRNGTISDYIHLGGSLVAIRERDTATDAYATKYQHTDALGSPVAVTDGSRSVVDRDRYAPYGAQIGGTPNDGVGYTGHVMDAASGLTYMQQRYYDPELRRFLSVDPVTANPNIGANFNRYWYANNNPYRFTDPDGRMIRPMGTPFGGGCQGRSLCAPQPIRPDVQLGGPGDYHAAHAADGNSDDATTTDENSGLGGDIFAVAEAEFAGIWGGEVAVGVVVDLDDLGDSGLFGTAGNAYGATVGASAGVGYMARELEGKAVGLDLNLEVGSVSLQADSEGLNGGAFTVGPGIGGAVSTTTTRTISINEVIEWFREH